MEFSQQENNQNSITSIEKDYVSLEYKKVKTPCFISKKYSCEIDINNIDSINKQALFPLSIHDDIDLLIIGTGDKSVFLSPKQQVEIQNMGIGIESMNNQSACRSFNLLLSDARNVGLLLL